MSRSSDSLGWTAGGVAAAGGRGSSETFRALILLGLVVCIGAAVLMFGGVEPRVLTAIETLMFSIFALSLWMPGSRTLVAEMPWRGPALLLAFVGMQALLLPTLNQYFAGQVLRLLLYLCTFLLAARFGRDPAVRHRLVLLFVWMGLMEAAYGVVLYLIGSRKILYLDKFAYLDRATGTYVNPNHFAGFLGMIFPVAAAAAFYNMSRLRGERVPEKMNRYFWGAVFHLMAALIIFIAIVASQSRLGLISALSAILATSLMVIAASWNRRGVILALAAFLLLTLSAGLWIGAEPIATRYEILESSYQGRRAIWTDTMDIVRGHPLLGTGLGSFRVEYTKYQRVYLEYLVDHAHNDYLQFAAELGIPGAVLLFGLLLVPLLRGVLSVRQHKRQSDWLLVTGMCGGVVAILVHSFGDFNLQIPANAMVLAALLGLLQSWIAPRSSRRKAKSGKSPVPEEATA